MLSVSFVLPGVFLPLYVSMDSDPLTVCRGEEMNQNYWLAADFESSQDGLQHHTFSLLLLSVCLHNWKSELEVSLLQVWWKQQHLQSLSKINLDYMNTKG